MGDTRSVDFGSYDLKPQTLPGPQEYVKELPFWLFLWV